VPSETDLVNRILREIVGPQQVAGLDPDGLIQDQIDFDSLDFLRLVTGLSEEAHIDIPEGDYPYLATLNGTYAYVRGRLTS
jgi:acyl carrier protein